MGPPNKNALTISQDAFDELVKENMEDLGMDPVEALEDAIQTLTLQGVDLSGNPQTCHFFTSPLSPSGKRGKEKKMRTEKEIILQVL